MSSSTHLILFTLGLLAASFAKGAETDIAPSVDPTNNKNSSSTVVPPTTTSTKPRPSTVGTSTVSPPVTSTVTPPGKDDFWVLKDPKTGQICLVAQLKIQLDIPYVNTSQEVVMAHVTVPGNSTGTGNCSSSDRTLPQNLVLSWGEPNYTNIVTLNFASNTTSKQFWLDSVMAVISVDNKTFPNITGTVKQMKMVNSSRHFETPLDNSYSCPAKLNIPASLTPLVVNHTAYFTFDHFHLEPFKNSTKDSFSTAIYCEGDNTPDIVPILVGCTLVGLVIIVLGVYLWGRRRSQPRGYLSM